MKCLHIYIAILTYNYIFTVISAAVPQDICETCVPTQDCPLFENLSYRDQLLWMEKFPCGSLPNSNDFKVPAGFASAAKGDYVCCSNNIWGIEKPDRGPQIGHQSSDNNPTNSNLADYSNTENRNKFNTIDDSPIYFPDWDEYHANTLLTYRPENSSNNWNSISETNKPTDYSIIFPNKPTDYSIIFPNNNHTMNSEIDDTNLHTVNNHPNEFEVSDGSTTIWFPNRTQNYDNTNYWLTHDPGNSSNRRPDQGWNIGSTQRTPITNFPSRSTTASTPIYYTPEMTPRPTLRNPDYDKTGNSPSSRYPFNNIPVTNPDVNRRRPPNQLYPREKSRPPIRNWPPNIQPRLPTLFYPSENIYLDSYVPRQNSRFPPRYHYVLPRQPFVYDDQQRPFSNDQGRNENSYINNGPYTQPPFDDNYQGNFGGGQCARLTSFPPDPQTNCCGRQLADADRITGRFPKYNQPAYTNHWERPRYYDSAPIWNTRDEVSVNATDEEVTVERRISGGQATELYQYPWTVLLLTTFDYGKREAAFNCGGGLISARFVLTAGHCVYDKEASVKSVQVNLAEYDKRTFPKDCKTTRSGRRCIENIVMYVEHIITHPQYQNDNLLNDIALLRLRGSAPYTDYIRPICLPTFNIDESQFSNLQFEVAGWGRNGPYSSEIKQSTSLHLTDHQQCKRYYPQLTNKHLCAAGTRGADTCKGDSGGPLMILHRGRYYVAGIVSGKRADSPCGTAVPSLYTNVYHYIDWINSNIRSQS